MADAWFIFQSCGWPAWVCLLLGVLATGLSVGALLAAVLALGSARTFVWLALALSLLPPLAGVLGQQRGRAITDDVLSSGAIDPAYVEEIRKQGYAEASACLSVGGTLGALPFVVAVGALVFVLSRPKAEGLRPCPGAGITKLTPRCRRPP